MTYLIPTEPLPTSIFSLSVTENQVDIVRKLQEDPLYLIQKREIESREQLLKNPRKMKQLQEMVSWSRYTNTGSVEKIGIISAAHQTLYFPKLSKSEKIYAFQLLVKVETVFNTTFLV